MTSPNPEPQQHRAPPDWCVVPDRPVEPQAVVSLVLGSVSLLTSWVLGVCLLALVGAVVAVTAGVVALVRLRTGEKTGAGLAVTGVCLGGFAAVVAGFMSLYFLLWALDGWS